MNLLLLVLRILFDLGLDVGYKQNTFSKILPEKNFKFVPSKRNSIVVFILGLVLLSVESDFILKKQGRKRDTLVVYNTSYIKMILTLLREVVALYMQTFIV